MLSSNLEVDPNYYIQVCVDWKGPSEKLHNVFRMDLDKHFKYWSLKSNIYLPHASSISDKSYAHAADKNYKEIYHNCISYIRLPVLHHQCLPVNVSLQRTQLSYHNVLCIVDFTETSKPSALQFIYK